MALTDGLEADLPTKEDPKGEDSAVECMIEYFANAWVLQTPRDNNFHMWVGECLSRIWLLAA